jgi:acetyltransferase-like isoleucine patch superfamily enzyme
VGRRATLERLPWRLRYRLGRRVASNWRRRMIAATHRHVDVQFRGPVHIGPRFDLRILDRGSFVVGSDVEFRSQNTFEIAEEGRVEIGDGCIFSWNTIVQCTTTVTFDPGVVLSVGVLVVDGNHKFRDPDKHFLQQGYNFRPIHFGAGSLVLAQSVVIADVGEHAVVGANSVVTKPVPPYCLAIGTPAQVVEYFGPPELRPPGLEI